MSCAIYNMIDSVELDGQRVRIRLDDDLFSQLEKNHVVKEREFWYELTCIEGAPSSVLQQRKETLAIPCIINLAPIIWRLGLKVSIKRMDSSLLSALHELREAYRTIWKEMPFLGELTAIETYEQEFRFTNKGVSLYSGGVDSSYTVIANSESIDCLLTIHGGDIKNDDNGGIFKSIEDTKIMAKSLRKSAISIKSNFMDQLDYTGLANLLPKGCDWWTNMQHGPTLTAFMIVVANALGGAKCFIASTHALKYLTRLGSRPDLETYLSYSGIEVIHDGVEMTRQQKIAYIFDHFPNKKIHVCYSVRNYENCGVCPKCLRTASGILALGNREALENNFNNLTPSVMLQKLREYVLSDQVNIDWGHHAYWKDIQLSIKGEGFYNEKGLGEWIPVLSFLKETDFYRLFCSKTFGEGLSLNNEGRKGDGFSRLFGLFSR